VITWLKDQGTAGKYFFATFDLDQDIVGAIKDGMIKEAVDQQPFIQGYDGVEVLVNYVRYGVIQANDIWSGPNLITKANLGPVVALAGKYR
jgi:simple sugar transport system substrate-binding protein